MPQDMPPTGGYSPVQYKRNLPARGFRPAVYLFGTAALMTYGFWKVGQGIREHKYVKLPLEFAPCAHWVGVVRTDRWQRTRAREDVGADTPHSSTAGRRRQGPSTKISGGQGEGEGAAWFGDEDLQQRQVR
jgi:hypothetical protein